jgi:hypothetical protein
MPEQTGSSRHELLNRFALAGAGALAGGVLLAAVPEPAESGPSPERDAEILNFALLLEYVQQAFYTDALRRAGLTGETAAFARSIGAQEGEHIDAIKQALGSKARKPPTLDFGDDTATQEAFVRSAVKLEDLGVKAYNSQAPNLTPGALAAAAEIVSVEARHAAWIRAIAGQNPAPDASEPSITAGRVIKILDGSGYVR